MKTRFFKILIVLFLGLGTYVSYPYIQQISKNIQTPTESAAAQPLANAKSEGVLAQAEPFRQTLKYLTKSYFDTASLDPYVLLKEALHGVSRAVSEILVSFPSNRTVIVEVENEKKSFTIPNLKTPEDMFPLIQEIFSYIETHYQGDVELNDILYSSINGMLDSLDPHSSLLPPKMFSEFKTQTEGEFGGIGIVIGLKDGELTVIAPLPNTPAAKAGLRSKDKITQIGEEASINMNLNEAVEKLRGKVGSQVSLTVTREDANSPLNFVLTRANIKIESVQSKLLSDAHGDIGIIKIKSFQEETSRELARHLKSIKAKSKNLKGIILDLRNNPGGLLNQAIDIADRFLEEGTIVLTVGANNQIIETDDARNIDGTEPYPIVVLVNDGSASASEIVAGAIKNNNRGIVIGSQTFGKGSVQSVYSLKDGSALKLTVAQYLTPGKHSIQSVGITPDIKIWPMVALKDRVDLVESQSFGEKDLEKHLESVFKHDSKPVYSLGYFLADPPKLDDKDRNDEDLIGDINPDKDFAIQFSKQILEKTNSQNREEMLNEIKDLVENTKIQEEKKLELALQSDGIDWSVGETKGKPAAQVTFNIHSNNGEVLQAGEEVKLELKVHNTGNAPFYRLESVTESENFLLKNKEFIFGKIAPGETKSWTLPIKIPASSLRREDKLIFNFREAKGNAPESFQVMVNTSPLKSPAFSYRMELFDNGQNGSKGNGDQKINIGERIALKLIIKNEGDGTSKNTVVNLKNLDGEGIFLNKGRDKIAEIAPGETKEALLQFTLDPAFSKEKADLELTISDQETLESLRKKIALSVGSTWDGELTSESFGGPKIVIKNGSFPTKTSQKKISLSGIISDPLGLKDVSIFVGENKSFLKSFDGKGGATKESPFEAQLSLKDKNNNLITVIARNQRDIVSRQSFFVLQE